MKLHNITYQDWFINQKRIPDEASEEYRAFFNFHKELETQIFNVVPCGNSEC